MDRLIYKYLGENLTDNQFKKILDVLFRMNSVQKFVNAEIDKSAFCDITLPSVINLSDFFAIICRLWYNIEDRTDREIRICR